MSSVCTVSAAMELNIVGLFCSVLAYVHVVRAYVRMYYHSPHSLHAIFTTSTLPPFPTPSSHPSFLSFPLPPTFSISLQAKSRLDLSAQTAKQNYQKELDAREEELDKIRSTMNRRVRSLEAALEEEHSEKQAAVKVRRLHIL